jgi:Icc-related predicted phosphoesterase
MRVVLISDTHTQQYLMDPLPEGDLLVHAGDMCSYGKVREAQATLDWLNQQPHRHVVAIAGNHDWAFAVPDRKEQLDLGRVIYLEDSGTEIEGRRFYGSPWQPEFCNWAFNLPRGAALREKWDLIPEGLDVLITHGPPKGIHDQASPRNGSESLGCEDLASAVRRVKPRVHVFGHIHGGYGMTRYGNTVYVNAAICDEQYKPTNRPIVMYI